MFVHLRLHTEFSVVDGTNRIDDTAKTAAADGQPALVITDFNNLFGAIKFFKTAVPYKHLRAHETSEDLVCRLLLEKKKINKK